MTTAGPPEVVERPPYVAGDCAIVDLGIRTVSPFQIWSHYNRVSTTQQQVEEMLARSAPDMTLSGTAGSTRSRSTFGRECGRARTGNAMYTTVTCRPPMPCRIFDPGGCTREASARRAIAR